MEFNIKDKKVRDRLLKQIDGLDKDINVLRNFLKEFDELNFEKKYSEIAKQIQKTRRIFNEIAHFFVLGYLKYETNKVKNWGFFSEQK